MVKLTVLHTLCSIHLLITTISEVIFVFSNRVALKQAIRALAQTMERRSARIAAGAEFEDWLASHMYLGRAAPDGARSKAVTWTAAEDWPGSIEWYTLDDSVIGRPELGGLFYEIPFADLERMPIVIESPLRSRKPQRAGSVITDVRLRTFTG